MIRLLTPFFLFAFCTAWCQKESPLDNLVIESFGYPDFGDNSSYGTFDVEYPIGEGTFVSLSGANQQNAAFRRFNSRLAIKQRLTKRVFGVGGYETEWDLTKPGWKQDASKSMYLGIEYESKPNWSMNAGVRSFLNQPSFSPLGTQKNNAKAQWSLGSKLKF